MATEWSIRKKQGACALCGRDFEDGERLLSFLCVEDGEIARRDVCQSCRTENSAVEPLAERLTSPAAEGQQPVALYWWSTRHRADRRPTFQLDLDLIERLFLDLEGRAEEKLRELRYLLCLLLMRKRRVKLSAVRRGPDGEALLVHRPRQDERLVVHVHDFRPERMEELRARLQALLEGVEPEALEDAPASQAPTPAADPAETEQPAEQPAESPGAQLAAPAPEPSSGRGTRA